MAKVIDKDTGEVLDVVPTVIIPGMPKRNKLHMLNASQRIVTHRKHSYDEYGRVIVVDAPSEDLLLSIGQYQDDVGPKNVVKQILNGADPNMLLHQNEGSYVDVTGMTAHSVNEFRDEVLVPAQNEAAKALEAFNKKYNTNLSMEDYLTLTANKTLENHVKEINKTKTETTDGGDK